MRSLFLSSWCVALFLGMCGLAQASTLTFDYTGTALVYGADVLHHPAG